MNTQPGLSDPTAGAVAPQASVEAPLDALSLALLLALAEAPPAAGLSLPRLGKRLQLGASVVLRQLHSLSAARIAGRDGPGWVRVEQDDVRWMAFITDAGRERLAGLELGS